MKKLITILLIAFCFSAMAQNKVRSFNLLENWTFSKDTTVYVVLGWDYRFQIQVEGTTLSAIDGVFKIKTKMNDLSDYVFYTEDTTNSIFIIDNANYNESFKGLNTMADSIQFIFLHNSVATGKLDVKVKFFPNR